MCRFFFTCALIPLALLASEESDSSEPVAVHQEPHESSSSSLPSTAPNFFTEKRKPMRASVRHIEAGGIGYKHGYTSLDLVLGTHTEKCYPFLDLRGHYFNNGKWAANGGVGFRYLPTDWNTIFGLNAYYDYRRDHKTNFQQAGAGVEFLRAGLELRLNGYLPFGTKSSGFYDAQFAYFQGNSIFLEGKKYVAMAGGDGEVGYNFFTDTKRCSLYFGVGPYYYHPPCGSNAFGGRARVSAKFTDYFSVDVIETYDNVFHNNTQGQISLNVPFGPTQTRSSKTPISPPLEYRMVQPVVRDEIIVLSKCKEYPLAINPATGEPYFVLFVNNLSSSAGTFESPYPTLAEAEGASSPNDLIYVFPGNGTTTGMNAGITLKDYQQLLGSSSAHPIGTQFGLLSIPSLTSGFGPIIANNLGPVVTVANGNTVSGLYIQFLNGAGITNGLTARTNLEVTQNIFEGSGFNGIDLSSAHLSGTVSVASNKFNIDDYALAITNSGLQNTSYSILNNYITTTDTTAAINISYTNCENLSTVISGNTIQSPSDCILFTTTNSSTPSSSNSMTVENNTFNARLRGLNTTLQGSSNTVFAINSNSWLSTIRSNILVTASGAAESSFSINSNSAEKADAIFGTGFLDILSTSSGSGNVVLNNNLINSGYHGVNLYFSGPFSIVADGNLIDSVQESFIINPASLASGSVSILNNRFHSYTQRVIKLTEFGGSTNLTAITIGNNVLVGAGAVSAITLTTTSTPSISITDNTIEAKGFAIPGAASSNGGISLSLTPSSTTQQVVAINNNTIYSANRGVNLAVNSATANIDFDFSNNTMLAGERGLSMTLTDAAALSMNMLNNTIHSQSIGFFLDAPTIASAIPFSCNMQNNNIQVGNNNAVKFTVAAASFSSTIRNNDLSLVVFPSYVKELLLISYTGSSSSADASLTIEGNRFVSADTALGVSVSGTTATMTANIADNYFGLSGSSGSSGATVALTTNNSSSAIWTIGSNTFESWDTSALTVTTLNTSSACVQFTGNKAQPIPSAYSFVQTGGTLTLDQSNNVGEISNTGSSGTCP